MPAAAVINSTPIIINIVFSAIIFRLRTTEFRSCALSVRVLFRAPRAFWFPAMEQSAAGPARQTLALQTAALLLRARALPPTHSSNPPAESLPHLLLLSCDDIGRRFRDCRYGSGGR